MTPSRRTVASPRLFGPQPRPAVTVTGRSGHSLLALVCATLHYAAGTLTTTLAAPGSAQTSAPRSVHASTACAPRRQPPPRAPPPPAPTPTPPPPPPPLPVLSSRTDGAGGRRRRGAGGQRGPPVLTIGQHSMDACCPGRQAVAGWPSWQAAAADQIQEGGGPTEIRSTLLQCVCDWTTDSSSPLPPAAGPAGLRNAEETRRRDAMPARRGIAAGRMAFPPPLGCGPWTLAGVAAKPEPRPQNGLELWHPSPHPPFSSLFHPDSLTDAKRQLDGHDWTRFRLMIRGRGSHPRPSSSRAPLHTPLRFRSPASATAPSVLPIDVRLGDGLRRHPHLPSPHCTAAGQAPGKGGGGGSHLKDCS